MLQITHPTKVGIRNNFFNMPEEDDVLDQETAEIDPKLLADDDDVEVAPDVEEEEEGGDEDEDDEDEEEEVDM